jgi:hypothetical protein
MKNNVETGVSLHLDAVVQQPEKCLTESGNLA